MGRDTCLCLFNPLYTHDTCESKMRTFANNSDPDEMPHNHQVLHSLLRQNDFQRKKIYLEIITCDPLIYTMDPPKFIFSKKKQGRVNNGLIKVYFMTFW